MTVALTLQPVRTFALGLIGLALSLGLFFATVPQAHAAGLTEVQIQAVLGLLSSFNVDQATVINVSAALHGQPPAGSAGAAAQTSSGTATNANSSSAVPTFTASPTSGQAPLSVTFTALKLSAGSGPYQVTFGDSTSGYLSKYACYDGTSADVAGSCDMDVTHSYASAGTYTAKLLKPIPTTDANPPAPQVIGTVTITVTSPAVYIPAVSFSATPASGNAPLNVVFTTNVSGASVDFGDGTSAVVSANCAYGTNGGGNCATGSYYTSHAYQTAGTYTTTLRGTYCPSSSGIACAQVISTLGTTTVSVTGSAQPFVTAISPSSGGNGTQVIIIGTGFSNTNHVYLSNVSTSVTYGVSGLLSSSGGTTLSLPLAFPADIQPGQYRVLVCTSIGGPCNWNSSVLFTIPGNTAVAPAITAAPTSVASGGSVKYAFTFPQNTNYAVFSVSCNVAIHTGSSNQCGTQINVLSNTDYTLPFYNTSGSAQQVTSSYCIGTSDGQYHPCVEGPTVTVSGVVQANPTFSAWPASGTAPLVTYLTVSGISSPSSYTIAFGDGGTSSSWQADTEAATTYYIAHTYQTAGTYTATLSSSSAGSCSSGYCATSQAVGAVTVTVSSPSTGSQAGIFVPNLFAAAVMAPVGFLIDSLADLFVALGV